MENSSIEWTDHTWNPWTGCTKVDALCAHCYAEARDIRFSGGSHWGPGKPRQRTSAANWREPYRWNRAYTDALRLFQDGKGPEPTRARVFTASLADWLDAEIPIEWLADTLQVIDENRNLIWLPLTKRPELWRARLTAVAEMLKGGDHGPRRMVEEWLAGRPPEHVWIGTSVGDQKSADTRIPKVLQIPAVKRFLSCEPLLGPVEFSNVTNRADCVAVLGKPALDGIHWVIAGGESGKEARPMHADWARSLCRQAVAAGVPYLFKQWGEWAPTTQNGSTIAIECAKPGAPQNPQFHTWPDGAISARIGKHYATRMLDGREWNEVPV